MKRIVIGTAGHVDHGKTSLIKALTGVDCDRLKEEKQRGLTIELGFTSLTLPSGGKVSVVDVPGHVRFIRHMLSGASGIDCVLLVVAADEGVMPQTMEHVQICELLGIKRGVVALTKVDLVDEDLLELAAEDVKEYISGTFLKDAPVVPVSSSTGQGLAELVDLIERELGNTKEKKIEGIPMLPIDRVFSMKGFGTVVTGTMARGIFHETDDVEVLPSGKKSKIRNIQVHSREVDETSAGMRTAVNLQGLSTDEISRGEWVVPAGAFLPTKVLDVRLDLIKEPGRSGIKFYIGTCESYGQMSLHETGDMKTARIRLKKPVVACWGDRFIIRDISPAATIGGGEVLNPSPARRFSSDVAADLASDDFATRIAAMIKDSGINGISRIELKTRFGESGSRFDKSIHDLLSKGKILRFDAANEIFVSSSYSEKLKNVMVEKVEFFHSNNPDAQGMSREHLRSSLRGSLDARLFHRLLTELVKAGILEEKGPSIMKKGFRASLNISQEDLERKLLGMLEGAAFEPPRICELSEKIGSRPEDITRVLGFMCRNGSVVKIKDDIYLTIGAVDELKSRVASFMETKKQMAPADFKEIVGVSRKYAIPYLEYLDRIHFTIRVDNVRKLV